MKCLHCDEEVTDEDLAAGGREMPFGDLVDGELVVRPSAEHRECLLRAVLGSVGHQLGRCRCHGGTDDDPPGMTRREAARAAVELFERSMDRKPD